MVLYKIETKKTITRDDGVEIPEMTSIGSREVLCQDFKNVYVRRDGSYGDVPMVEAYSKKEYRFFNADLTEVTEWI